MPLATMISVPEKETRNFYNTLEETFDKNKQYYTIIMSDFNAKLGADSPDRVSLGNFAVGTTNKIGLILANVADKYNL